MIHDHHQIQITVRPKTSTRIRTKEDYLLRAENAQDTTSDFRQLVKSNPALEEILAISKEGLWRGDYRNRRYFRSDGSLMPSEEFASTRVEKGEKSVYHVETGVEKEDGSMVWTDISAATCGYPDWHTVIATSDITQRVEMENKNQHLLEQLRRTHARFAKIGRI
jgi:PAS domain-containing protein